ncbi:MAG TPA: 50S ribosomal protein L21 [Gaiellaceae bacterium]|jgi:large subunit ribosomal protein L21
MDYAIIKLGNKQHRVRDGETLIVDRLPTELGKSFEPDVLLGEAKVTATILEHGRGKKILIGKYRRRTGYKRHNGFRAATSKVEITIGAGAKRAAKSEKPAAHEKPEAAKAEDQVVQAAVVEAPEVEAAPVEAAPVEAAKAETPKAETPKAETPKNESSAAAPPAGYEDLTVAQIHTETKGWSVADLEAALAYEKEHADRKGAVSALESALKKEEAEDGA